MPPQVFTSSVIRKIKLRLVVETIGRDILHACVLSCCQDTIETIAKNCEEGYIKRKHPSNGNIVKENLFTKESIKAKEDPTGQSFDITFLSKILLLIECDHSNLYVKIKAIKGERNDLFHQVESPEKQEYEQQMAFFANLFLDTLQEAELVADQQKSEVTSQIALNEIDDGLLRIKTLRSNLTSMISKIKDETIEEGKIHIIEYLKKEGQSEISKAYDRLIYVNPVEFFIGTKYKILVSNFFTELEFYDKDEEDIIAQDNVIEMALNASGNVVVEGIAGAGKTTLIRTIMALKKERSDSDSFLIHFDCRNDSFSCLKDFLSYIMPETSNIFSPDKLIYALISLNPTFLVDGLDELNENSEKILKEIMDFVKREDATIFASSRPEGVKKFLRRLSGSEFRYLEIRGILKEKQDELIEKYRKIFSPHFSKTTSPSLEEVTKSLKEIRHSFKEYIRIPLILCLLIYLIMSNKNLNAGHSFTEIYTAIINALIAKLKTRISSTTQLPDFEIDERVEDFLSFIYEISLRSLKMNEIILKYDSASKIRKKVKEIFGQYREDALSSIFVCRGYLTPLGYERTSYSYPHKSFQEFFAAKHLQRIFCDKPYSLWEMVGPQHLGNKNLLLFIVGMMALEGTLRKELCEDIVSDFIKKRKNLGDFDTNLTFRIHDVLRETKIHPLMTDSISNHIQKISLDQRDDDLRLFVKIFEKNCPSLHEVNLRVVLEEGGTSETIESILTSLKSKDVELNLDFLSPEGLITNLKCDVYVKLLHNGNCKLGNLSACLGEEGINSLPNKIKHLTLYIASEREAAGLQCLNEHLTGINQNQRLILGRMTVHLLELIISRKFSFDLLPLRLRTIKGVLMLKLREVETTEDFHWAYQVSKRILPLRWIKEGNGSFNALKATINRKVPKMCALNIHCTYVHSQIKWLVQRLSIEGLYLTKFQLDCDQQLIEEHSEEINAYCKEKLGCPFASRLQLLARNVAVRLSEEGVLQLPRELKRLELMLKNEKDVKGLKCLTERMAMVDCEKEREEQPCSGAMKGIAIHCLKLLISRRCDAYFLPKKLPIPKEKLELSFGGVENDDIPWVIEVMDRLPKTADPQCKKIDIWLLNFHFTHDVGMDFLNELKGKDFQSMTIHITNKIIPREVQKLETLRKQGMYFNFYNK